jgi:hypothetical protein
VPAHAGAGAEGLGDPWHGPQRSERQHESAGGVEGAVRVGQGESLLLGNRVGVRGRVVLDVAARGLPAEPLGNVASGACGCPVRPQTARYHRGRRQRYPRDAVRHAKKCHVPRKYPAPQAFLTAGYSVGQGFAGPRERHRADVPASARSASEVGHVVACPEHGHCGHRRSHRVACPAGRSLSRADGRDPDH